MSVLISFLFNLFIFNLVFYLDSTAVVASAVEEKSKDTEHAPEFERGHSRNSSCTSQHSKASGYGSLAHSRQSSAESGHHRYGESILKSICICMYHTYLTM